MLFLIVEVVPPIQQLLEQYAEDLKEVYRRINDQSICIVMDSSSGILATLQVKLPDLVLLNLEIGAESSSRFNKEVCDTISKLIHKLAHISDISHF